MRPFILVLAATALAASALADDDPLRPAELQFGASPDELVAVLEDACSAQPLRTVEPEIPGATEQSQLDCEGFEWLGAPRLAEFVFADGRLALVWILVEHDELDGLSAAFTRAYGEPSHVAEEFNAFASHNAAVRMEPPEALYYSSELADAMTNWFDAAAAP